MPSLNDGSACNDQLAYGQSGDWLQDFIDRVDRRKPAESLHPTVERLKELIESRTELRMWASAMFEEVPNKVPYNNSNNMPSRSPVRDYRHMIDLLNIITTEVTPSWTMSTPAWGLNLVGFPFQSVFDWAMGTPSGHAFFLDRQVNAKLKDVLDAWRDEVLATSKSLSVMTVSPGGWLSKEAIASFEEAANLDGQWRTFEQLFHCDPRGDPLHWGFTSWDDFFIRRFRDMDKLRPVAYPAQPEWIASACEAIPVAIKTDIKQRDTFWLKGTHYSVDDMLGGHAQADHFVGGTVYQSVLKATAYHRWHAPVSGRVVAAQVIHGSYFSERSTNGLRSEPVQAPLYDQLYVGHVATRALIFIEADGIVGLMCFVAIGIADVSTCAIAERFLTRWPQRVTKGEEMGMFHHGGSTSCLLFRKGLKLAFAGASVSGKGGVSLAVRSPLAFAYN